MIYVDPKRETISAVYGEKTYSFQIYKPYKTISGVADENYPEWKETVSYSPGDFVIVPPLKRIYRSAVDGNRGIYPPSDPTVWVDYGFVNSYRMFSIDEGIGAVTSGENVVLEFDFSRSDTIGMIGAKWSKVLIEQIPNDEPPIRGETLGRGDGTIKVFKTSQKPVLSKSETIYINGIQQERDVDYEIDYFTGKITLTRAPRSGSTITIDYTRTLKSMVALGRDYGASNFYEYFFDEWADKTRLIINSFTRLIVDGLVWTPLSTLRLTFEGKVEIGAFVMGLQDDLGLTVKGTKMGFRDKSKIEIDEFTGGRKIIRYGHIRIMNAQVANYTASYSDVARKVNSIIGKNVLLIPVEDEVFAEMSNIGYIEYADLPADLGMFKASLSIVGVME